MDFSALPLPPAADLRPHAVSIYRADEQRAVSGKYEAQDWGDGPVATGVPCYFVKGKSVHVPQGLVSDEQDDAFSRDEIRFASGTDIRAEDILKQTTGPDSGEFWRVCGEPKDRAQIGRYMTVQAVRETVPPDGVS